MWVATTGPVALLDCHQPHLLGSAPWCEARPYAYTHLVTPAYFTVQQCNS